MRIVFVSTGHPAYDVFPNGGGIQSQILGTATELATLGHDVHVICRATSNSLHGRSRATFHAIGGIGADQILSVLLFSKRAARLLSDLEPDVISTYERFSAYFPSLTRYRITFTTENYDAFRYYRAFAVQYNPLNVLVHPWKRHLEEGVMKRCNRVVALTPSTRTYLESVGIRHVDVVPNGVSSDDYANLGDEGYILYAGRLDAPKRVDLLIQAYARLKEYHRDFSLVIVGKGPRRDELSRLATQCNLGNRVIFREWVARDELAQLVGRCTVFVLPSVYETFGIALVEAMACAKPVIAARVPGPQDYITNGENGMLFESGNVDQLAEALKAFLENSTLRRSLGTKAKKTVDERFDFKRVTADLLRVFEAILAE